MSDDYVDTERSGTPTPGQATFIEQNRHVALSEVALPYDYGTSSRKRQRRMWEDAIERGKQQAAAALPDGYSPTEATVVLLVAVSGVKS